MSCVCRPHLFVPPSPGASKGELVWTEASILHRQHGLLVVWEAGGALEESPGHQVLCDQDCGFGIQDDTDKTFKLR